MGGQKKRGRGLLQAVPGPPNLGHVLEGPAASGQHPAGAGASAQILAKSRFVRDDSVGKGFGCRKASSFWCKREGRFVECFFMGAVAPDRILYLFQAKWHVAFINIFSVVSASPVVVVVFLI